jgi:predicted short-subunit dehydrogenase-like oxidoreductase (DUF2520 family)
VTERVLIVGAGHVGRGLFRAFRASGMDVLGLHGRRPSAHATSSGRLPPSISDANTIVVAVRDDQIDDALAELMEQRSSRSRNRLASGTVILHTSGSSEPELIPRLAEIELSGGTFHPLVPFANPDRAAEMLRHAWIGIDGDDQARATSRRLAGHIGARTLDIPPGGKSLYHAAAVLSSNFPVVLASIAADLLTSLGIAERSAQQAVHGLMEGAVQNMTDGSPSEVLTGPIVRGDIDVVMRHLAALRAHADAKAVYKRLSLAALTIAADRGTDPEKIDALQKTLLLR